MSSIVPRWDVVFAPVGSSASQRVAGSLEDRGKLWAVLCGMEGERLGGSLKQSGLQTQYKVVEQGLVRRTKTAGPELVLQLSVARWSVKSTATPGVHETVLAVALSVKRCQG